MCKIFVVNFEDGFDITTDLRRIKWVVDYTRRRKSYRGNLL